MADYIYQPVYGVEPWQDNAGVGYPADYGGGARVTAQNLVISMWGEPTGGGSTPVFLVPGYATPGALEQDAFIAGSGTKGTTPIANSRTSSRFALQVELDGGLDTLFYAFLNPPSDFKSQVQNAVKANLNAPNGIEVLKSLYSWLAFEFYVTNLKSQPLVAAATFSGIFGFLPLFATSGADGVFPEALPDLLGDGLPAAQSTLNAINSGNFYIMCLFFGQFEEPDTTAVYTINWPHTAARG